MSEPETSAQLCRSAHVLPPRGGRRHRAWSRHRVASGTVRSRASASIRSSLLITLALAELRWCADVHLTHGFVFALRHEAMVPHCQSVAKKPFERLRVAYCPDEHIMRPSCDSDLERTPLWQLGRDAAIAASDWWQGIIVSLHLRGRRVLRLRARLTMRRLLVHCQSVT